MLTINASEFKAKCLEILDRVRDSGEEVLILKRGKPVARLVAALPSQRQYPQEDLIGTVTILADLTEPVIPEDSWEVLRMSSVICLTSLANNSTGFFEFQ